MLWQVKWSRKFFINQLRTNWIQGQNITFYITRKIKKQGVLLVKDLVVCRTLPKYTQLSTLQKFQLQNFRHRPLNTCPNYTGRSKQILPTVKQTGHEFKSLLTYP